MKRKIFVIIIVLFASLLLADADSTFTINQPILEGIRDACPLLQSNSTEEFIWYLWDESQTTREYTAEEILMLGDRYYVDYFSFEDMALNAFKGVVDYSQYYLLMGNAIDSILAFNVANFKLSIFDSTLTNSNQYAQYDTGYQGNTYNWNDGLQKNLTPYMRGRHLAYGLNFFAFTVDMAYYYMSSGQQATAIAKVDSLADWAYETFFAYYYDSNYDDPGWEEEWDDGILYDQSGLLPNIGLQTANRMLVVSGIGYCSILAGNTDLIDDFVLNEFDSSFPIPSGSSFYGMKDYYVTNSGMYSTGLTYQNRALYLSPLFFTALARKNPTMDNLWNSDLISGIVKQTLRRIDPQLHHLIQEDDYRETVHDKQIEQGLIQYYYNNTSDSDTRGDIGWYITRLKENAGGYPDQWEQHDFMNDFVAVMCYNPSVSFAENDIIPPYLANGSYLDEELSILRPETTLADLTINGINTTPQLFVSHENSYVTNHWNYEKTGFQLFYGGEYFIIDSGYAWWIDGSAVGTNWTHSAYSKNLIIINPDSTGSWVGSENTYHAEYDVLDDLEANLIVNRKDPDSFQSVADPSYIADPANRLFHIDNNEIEHLKVGVHYDNAIGAFFSGTEYPCEVYRNYYMLDDNYYMIYDETDNTTIYLNKYRNQIHLNNTGDTNNNITITQNASYPNMFTEQINGKYLHGILGASNAFKVYFDDQNLPLAWSSIPDVFHSRLRITSENPTINEQFFTLLIPSESSTNPIDSIFTGAGQYAAKYSLNTGYNCYAAVSDGNYIDCDNGNTRFVTDASFLLVEANNIFTDLKKLILNSDNFLEVQDRGGTDFTNVVVFDSDYDSEEVISEWENDELEITTVMRFEGSAIPDPVPIPKYKILRCGVLPDDLISKTYYYCTGGLPQHQRGTIADNIESLAYDDDYFYVNYDYSDLVSDNLLTVDLTIYEGVFDDIDISGESQFGTGDIEFKNEITVPVGTELIFTSGSNPKMNNEVEFIVNGQVTAVGNTSNVIEFEKKTLADWTGFKINTSGEGDFQYCRFTGADNPIRCFGEINLQNSEITDCDYGLHLNSSTAYYIGNNTISYCDEYGVYIGNISSSIMNSFEGNSVSYCDDGLFLYNTNAEIDNNMFYYNYANGMYISRRSNSIIQSSYIGYTLKDTTDYPEIYLIDDSYPVLDNKYNDIIIDRGGSSISIYNASEGDSRYFCRQNFWGDGITSAEVGQSFYPTAWDVTYLEICDSSNTEFTPPGRSMSLFEEGLQAEKDGYLFLARETYLLSIDQNPDEIEALWSASRLLNCVDPSIGFGFYEAQQLYEGIMTDSLNTDLYELARQNVINCDRKMGDFQEAICQYELMFEDSLTFIDSVFIQLDIVYTYMEAEAAGGRSRGLRFSSNDHAVKDSKHAIELEKELLNLLLQRTEEIGDFTPVIDKVKLHGNYPNPFNPTTKISFSIPDESKVKLTVYNIKGQKVRTLVNDQLERGMHDVIWNGRNANNKSVASGVYFYRLNVNKKTYKVKKMLLLK